MKKTILLLFFPAVIFAQNQPLEMKSNTEGFSVGLSGNYLGWSSEYFTLLDDQESSGIGIGLELGYGFTQRFELIGRLDFSSLALENEWDYFNFYNTNILARFNPGSTTSKLRPYIEVGVGNQNLVVSPIFFNNAMVEYDLSGWGIAYGGGLNYFINRNLLITLNAAGTSGKMQTFSIDGVGGVEDVPDVSNFRIRAGARFYLKDL